MSSVELMKAADMLLNNLWAGVVSGSRTHDENWKEFERRYPGVTHLHEVLRSPALTNTSGDDEAPAAWRAEALEEAAALVEAQWNHCWPSDIAAAIRSLARPQSTAVRDGWQPIETAPKDGTLIDLWHEEFGRFTDMYWGNPEHCCGEAGSYCDSEWHGQPEGWVFSVANEIIAGEHDTYTHWMPLPVAPALRSTQEGL